MSDHTFPGELLLDLRERIVRIETKLDTSAEKTENLTASVAAHDLRLNAIETEATQLRSSLSVFRWVGAAIVTIIGTLAAFADKL